MVITSISLSKTESAFGVRHVQAFFLFICCALSFHMRVNISVAVVAMTNANTTNPNFEEFPWEEAEKSYILSSYFWGSVLTQFAGGYLSNQYGSKYLLLGSTFGCSVLCLLSPAAVSYGGWQLLCVLRFFQGFFQGVMFPCFYSHLARWAPVEERNKLGGITQIGVDIGTLLGFVTSGFVAASNLGWPGIFYLPGGVGLIWSMLWLYFGANSPAESKIISLAERKRIEFSLEQKEDESNATKRQRVIPWKAIFTSGPYMALVFVKITQAWSFHTLMQQLPTYIHGMLKMGIKMNAVLSAVPYAIMFLLSYVFLMTADALLRRQCVSLSALRKSINSIASFVPAVAYIFLSYVDAKNVALNVTLLIIAVSSVSAQVIGSSLNHIDLAPNHAGILHGMTNTLVSVVGIVAPLTVGLVVKDDTDRSQWRIIFLLIAVILIIGNLVYIIFGRMERQPWNDTETMNGDANGNVEATTGQNGKSRFEVETVSTT